VSLQLDRHLVASGFVVATDGYDACEAGVGLKIQRVVAGRWRTLTIRLTHEDGFFRAQLPDRTGWYRARAMKVTLPTGDICTRATSGIRRHRH
jgi:hypothetical protein